MKHVLFLLLTVVLGIPAGVVEHLVVSPGSGDESPMPLAAEDTSDSAEMLKLSHLLYLGAGLVELNAVAAVSFHTITAECCLAAFPDRESHFCRPPPTVV